MLKAVSASHGVLVEDFMDRDVAFIWKGCTYRTLNTYMMGEKKFTFYPFVSSPESRLLLGTIHHLEIKFLLEKYLQKELKTKINQNNAKISFNGRFQILTNFTPSFKVNNTVKVNCN